MAGFFRAGFETWGLAPQSGRSSNLETTRKSEQRQRVRALRLTREDRYNLPRSWSPDGPDGPEGLPRYMLLESPNSHDNHSFGESSDTTK